jgi:transposase
MLPALLETSAKRFDMKRVPADKRYLSEANVQAIVDRGAEPFIPPKSNTQFGFIPDASRRKLATWNKMMYCLYRRDDFLRNYHRRSNAETVFHMIKSKFGSRIRSMTDTAQINEVLCKIVCHNLCVLVRSVNELGIEAKFSDKDSVA